MSASVLLVVLGAFPAAAGTHSPTGDPAPQGMAVFEWYRVVSQVNANLTQERLWSLRRDGFTVVYADVGEYLEAADQPESWSQRRQLRQLAGDLRRFVRRASSLGFTVHAVAGGPNWTAETHRYPGPKVLQLIADYNRDADPSDVDGSIELVEREFDYASRVADAASGIVVGQEFTEVTPTKLSFWWNGRAAFRQAVAELTDAYGGLPQFRGVAVDDADAYQAAGEYGPPW